MSEEEKKVNENELDAVEATEQVAATENLESSSEELVVDGAAPAEAAAGDQKGTKFVPRKGPNHHGGHGGKKKKTNNKRRTRGDAEQPSEFTEKVVQVRRVTKVVKGGKKLSFRTTVIIGNEKGKVGVGVGKASEVMIAIKKGISDARKNLIDVETVANTNTVSHAVIGKSSGAKVLLKPAADGTGIIAGGTARIVLELAGVGDILSKSQGSKSPLNVARATVEALRQMKNFQEVASTRGMSVRKMLFA